MARLGRGRPNQRRRPTVIRAAPASTDYVWNDADAAAAVDAVAVTQGENTFPGDVAAAADAVSITQSVSTAPADSAAASDAAAVAQGLGRQAADTAGVVDSATALLGATVSAADTAGAVDAVAAQQDAARTLADAAAGIDSTAITQTATRLAADAAGAVDAAAIAMDVARPAADVVAAADAVTATQGQTVALADLAAAVDATAVTQTRVILLSDAGGIVDAATPTLTPGTAAVLSSFGQPGTTFTATGLTPNTTYEVVVRASNAVGTSAYSTPVRFTTLASALPTGAVTGTLVSTDSTVATNPDARLGINTNYWMDNQAIRTGTPRTLAAALADLKPKIIRYPGGEKADGTTFFQAANQGASGGAGPNPRLNRIGTGGDAWPSSDSGYWNPPGDVNGTWASTRPPYALQTFLTDCATVGAQPLIVLALDGIYISPPAGGVAPTKAQMITNAQEMVRWLNVTNSYGVKYFEIGNETWQVAYLGGLGSTFANGAQYGTDFADVAAAMKAIDPTIQVGMNGNIGTFFDGFFSTAAAAVDFVSVHPYDTAGMSYTTYQSSTITATQISNARTSLDKLAAADRDRIWITVTESSHFATSDTDPNGINNLGSAIITAHLLGLQLNDSRVRHVIFWNTRWITNANATKLAYDAFAPDNTLLPVGQALRFLGKLSGRMVQATTGFAGLVVYASQVVADGRSSVLIINRSATSRAGTVGMAGAVAATAQRLSGTGATDTAPTLTNLGAITVTAGVTASITCPANSLTLVDFTY